MSNPTENAFWLVWSPTGARPPKHRHLSERSAIQEAERLAREHPGELFVVLEAIASRRVDAMVRTTFINGSAGIPF
ncbi:hypothetical protein FAZ95_13900 [Trinickia violacea]|uniref:DUF2188 domain-containing protein n=1 Tax=Trinickia violacea TaxID=2571746 RepID=A0A4P8IPH5_9BURK|nr:hypothetical protein [Trinickia violacea]QCP50176.1 hypothetical protein FAZ95_13900 [Trinickia violacea]